MAMKQNNFYLRWQKAAGAAKSESRSQSLRTLVPGLAVVAVSMLGWGVLTLHTSMPSHTAPQRRIPSLRRSSAH